MTNVYGRYGFPVVLAVLAAAMPCTAVAQNRDADLTQVKAVLDEYKASWEQMDAKRGEKLFASGARIFDNGEDQRSFDYYVNRHIGPELAVFKTFTFHHKTMNVEWQGAVALGTETYRYTIVTDKGETIERQGVSTSILKKVGGRWMITSMHSSNRKAKAE